MPHRAPVTMQQVADRAGVSISTVSFVVNATKPVTAETERRVLAAIDELGYRRNAAARALASSRTRVLALLYPLVDRNLDLFVDAAAREAEARGYTLVVFPVNPTRAAAAVASLIDARMADGVMLLEVQMDDERVDRLIASQARFVLIGRTRDPSDLEYVDVDFHQGVADAMDELVRRSHREITLIVEDFDDTPLPTYAPPRRVEQSFRELAAARDVDGRVVRLARKDSADITQRLLDEAPETTAIVLMHTDGTIPLLNGLRSRGISVPGHLSIVVVATSAPGLSSIVEPTLTSWDTPGRELGEYATRALIDRLDGGAHPLAQLLVACARRDGDSLGDAPVGRPPLDAFAVVRHGG